MRYGIHKEMAFQVLSDYPKQSALDFLVKGVAKPEWNKDMATKKKWLKEWMDMPDSDKHSSKLKNDHSYKLTSTPMGFKIVFAKSGPDQATVVARLKYAARSVREWKVEEEYRSCALELAKSIHWVVDMTSPSHVVAGWGSDDHSKVEVHFDRVWRSCYDKGRIAFERTDQIKDIYRWAKKRIEDNYARNLELKQIYEGGGSILQGRGKEIAQEVVLDVAQNLADYLAYTDKQINFDKIVTKLP